MKIKVYIKILLLIECILILSCTSDPILIDRNITKPVQHSVFTHYLSESEIVVIGSEKLRFASAFKISGESKGLKFEDIQGEYPLVMQDQNGTKYDFFGYAENSDIKLDPVLYSFGYWFSWASIYPGINLSDQNEIQVKLDYEIPENWEISVDYIFRGASYDAIDVLYEPDFIEFDRKTAIDNGFYLDDQDLVIIIPDGENVKVYPHKVLNYHEIIHDVVDEEEIVLTYFPFTATTNVWQRNVSGERLDFGSTGNVYNSNILLFDRQTNSIWSQMLGKCVNGFYQGKSPRIMPYIETRWINVKNWYKRPLVLSPDLGYPFDYSTYPFGDYATNPNKFFSPKISFQDDRHQSKDIVFGLSDGKEAIALLPEDFK